MNKLTKEQISLLKPSATLVINEESNRLKNAGKKIYKFGFGQSPFPVPESIVLELKNNASKNKYLPIEGLEELRIAIASHLNKYNNNNKMDVLKRCQVRIEDQYEVEMINYRSK